MLYYKRFILMCLALCVVNVSSVSASGDDEPSDFGPKVIIGDLMGVCSGCFMNPLKVQRALNMPEVLQDKEWVGPDFDTQKGNLLCLKMKKNNDQKGGQVIMGAGAFVGMANCGSTKSVMASGPFGLLGCHASVGKNCSLGGWLAPIVKGFFTCGSYNGCELCCVGCGAGTLSNSQTEEHGQDSPKWLWCFGLPISWYHNSYDEDSF